MDRNQYRRQRHLCRYFQRLIRELEPIGDILSKDSLAQRSAVAWFRGEYVPATRDCELTPADVAAHYPPAQRPPLHVIGREARSRLLRDAELRRWGVGVHPRFARSPIPR